MARSYQGGTRAAPVQKNRGTDWAPREQGARFQASNLRRDVPEREHTPPRNRLAGPGS